MNKLNVLLLLLLLPLTTFASSIRTGQMGSSWLVPDDYSDVISNPSYIVMLEGSRLYFNGSFSLLSIDDIMEPGVTDYFTRNMTFSPSVMFVSSIGDLYYGVRVLDDYAATDSISNERTGTNESDDRRVSNSGGAQVMLGYKLDPNTALTLDYYGGACFWDVKFYASDMLYDFEYVYPVNNLGAGIILGMDSAFCATLRLNWYNTSLKTEYTVYGPVEGQTEENSLNRFSLSILPEISVDNVTYRLRNSFVYELYEQHVDRENMPDTDIVNYEAYNQTDFGAAVNNGTGTYTFGVINMWNVFSTRDITHSNGNSAVIGSWGENISSYIGFETPVFFDWLIFRARYNFLGFSYMYEDADADFGSSPKTAKTRTDTFSFDFLPEISGSMLAGFSIKPGEDLVIDVGIGNIVNGEISSESDFLDDSETHDNSFDADISVAVEWKL